MKSQITTIVLLFICSMLTFSTTSNIEATPLISNPSPPHYCYDVVPQDWTTEWFRMDLIAMLPCQSWAKTFGYPGRCVNQTYQQGYGGECYNECRARAPGGWGYVVVPEECWWRCGGENTPSCDCPANSPDLGLHTCKNGATCDETYTCNCPQGWTGEFCDKAIAAYHWSTTSWSDCEPLQGHEPFPKMCWEKWANRNVTCLETSTSQVVDDSFCVQHANEPRPDTSRICHEKKCFGADSVCNYTTGLCECDEWSYGARCEYYYSWDVNQGQCKLPKPNQACGQPKQAREQGTCNLRTIARGMWVPEYKRPGCWEQPAGWQTTRDFDCGSYVQCENDGECDGEQCICPYGYEGSRCETRSRRWEWVYSDWSTQCTPQSNSQVCGYQGRTRTATCIDRVWNETSTQPNVDCLTTPITFRFDTQNCPKMEVNRCDDTNHDADQSWYCIGTNNTATTNNNNLFGEDWSFTCSTQKNHPNRIMYPPNCRNGSYGMWISDGGYVPDYCNCPGCTNEHSFSGERCEIVKPRFDWVVGSWGECKLIYTILGIGRDVPCGYQTKTRWWECTDMCLRQTASNDTLCTQPAPVPKNPVGLYSESSEDCPLLQPKTCKSGKCYGTQTTLIPGTWFAFTCDPVRTTADMWSVLLWPQPTTP